MTKKFNFWFDWVLYTINLIILISLNGMIILCLSRQLGLVKNELERISSQPQAKISANKPQSANWPELTAAEQGIKQIVDRYLSGEEILAKNIWWFQMNKSKVKALLMRIYQTNDTEELMNELYKQFEIMSLTGHWELHFDEKIPKKNQERIDQIKQLQKYLRHQPIKAKDAWWWHNCYNIIIYGTVRYDLHCPKDKMEAVLESIFSQYKIHHIGAN